MGTFKIVYRDAAGNDRKAFTVFEDNATIEENLARIVPRAIEKGLLHPEATAQNVLVEHKGVRLNLKLPIDQAALGIEENDDVVVRYLASQINLSMRIVADDPADQRKIFFGRRKTLSIKETVAVSPAEQLLGQIEEKLNEIGGKHKFYGKEVKNAKRFELRTSGKKIQTDMSLADQGFETDLEVNVKPRVWFDWPPCFYYGFRGPYTGHAITLGIILLILVPLFWRSEVNRFYVTFEAPFECNVKLDDSTEYIPFKDNTANDTLEAGLHTVHVYPRERPIESRPLLLKKKVFGRAGDSDREWREHLAPADTIQEDTTSVTVVGYEGASSMINLKVPLLFNGFEYPFREGVLSWHFDLVPGEYEIKFELADDKLISSDPGEGGVRKKSDFIFVVEDTTETTIKFRYGTGGDS